MYVKVLGRVITQSVGMLAVTCELAYDKRDPWAVALTLWPRTPDRVDWVFARELLADGRYAAVNPGGDVTVSPANVKALGEPWVRIGLSSRSDGRSATVLLQLLVVDHFLACSYREVPAGMEDRNVRWDLALRAWSGDGRAA